MPLVRTRRVQISMFSRMRGTCPVMAVLEMGRGLTSSTGNLDPAMSTPRFDDDSMTSMPRILQIPLRSTLSRAVNNLPNIMLFIYRAFYFSS